MADKSDPGDGKADKSDPSGSMADKSDPHLPPSPLDVNDNPPPVAVNDSSGAEVLRRIKARAAAPSSSSSIVDCSFEVPEPLDLDALLNAPVDQVS